jgi:hypothetical protein
MTPTKREKKCEGERERMSLMITTLKVRGFEFGCQISPANLDSSVIQPDYIFLRVGFSIDPT